MRVALCLKGHIGGKGRYSGDDKIIAERSFNYFRENLLNVNKNVDVFIHSWSSDYEDYLTNCYKPKKKYLKNKKNFHKIMNVLNL